MSIGVLTVLLVGRPERHKYIPSPKQIFCGWNQPRNLPIMYQIFYPGKRSSGARIWL